MCHSEDFSTTKFTESKHYSSLHPVKQLKLIWDPSWLNISPQSHILWRSVLVNFMNIYFFFLPREAHTATSSGGQWVGHGNGAINIYPAHSSSPYCSAATWRGRIPFKQTVAVIFWWKILQDFQSCHVFKHFWWPFKEKAAYIRVKLKTTVTLNTCTSCQATAKQTKKTGMKQQKSIIWLVHVLTIFYLGNFSLSESQVWHDILIYLCTEKQQHRYQHLHWADCYCVNADIVQMQMNSLLSHLYFYLYMEHPLIFW